VQRLSGEGDRPQRLGTEYVPLLADERMAAKPRLEADLGALAGVKADFHERRPAEGFHDAIGAHRFAAARIAPRGLLHDQRTHIPHQAIRPRPDSWLRMPIDDGEVDALRLVPLELLSQHLL